VGAALIQLFNHDLPPAISLPDGTSKSWLLLLYDNTPLAPIVAQAIRALPLAIMLLWHSFATLSDDVLAAAALDGLSPRRVFWKIAVPQRWQVATGLEPLGGGNGIFRFKARDYDELVDGPVECGTHRVLEFAIDDIPHKIALWGRGNEDEARLLADTQAIVTAQRNFFGGLPYKRYTFIHHLAGGRGGLEHRNSAVFLVDRFGFRPRPSYERFLELVSHEFFHVWNVKRIRPKALGPFDYRRENHTRQLWTMEGVTSYYEKRFVTAAGLYSKERYLERLAEEIGGFQAQPGRALQSLEQSSFDAWIKFYRPDENAANVSVSYYQKGALVAMMLDLEIRAATKRAKCLDDVVRHLAHQATLDDSGFAEPDGYLAAVEAVAGEQSGAFKRFFERYVAGTDELDYARALGHAGLALALTRPGAKDGERPGWLGVTTRADGRSRASYVIGLTPVNARG
jgi:predicted metalloprotease with PDZ domain